MSHVFAQIIRETDRLDPSGASSGALLHALLDRPSGHDADAPVPSAAARTEAATGKGDHRLHALRLLQFDDHLHTLRSGAAGAELPGARAAVARLRAEGDGATFAAAVQSLGTEKSLSPQAWLRRFAALVPEMVRTPGSGPQLRAAIERLPEQLRALRSSESTSFLCVALASLAHACNPSSFPHPHGPERDAAEMDVRSTIEQAVAQLRALVLDHDAMRQGRVSIAPQVRPALELLQGDLARDAAMGLAHGLVHSRTSDWDVSIANTFIGLVQRSGGGQAIVDMAPAFELLAQFSDRHQTGLLGHDRSSLQAGCTLVGRTDGQESIGRAVICRLATFGAERREADRRAEVIEHALHNAADASDDKAFSLCAQALRRANVFMRAMKQADDAERGLHALWRVYAPDMPRTGNQADLQIGGKLALVDFRAKPQDSPAAPRHYENARAFLMDTELQRRSFVADPQRTARLESAMERASARMATLAPPPGWMPGDPLPAQEERLETRAMTTERSLHALSEAYRLLQPFEEHDPQAQPLEDEVVRHWSVVFGMAQPV